MKRVIPWIVLIVPCLALAVAGLRHGTATEHARPPQNVALCFSPNGGCQNAILGEIAAARKEALVQPFNFSAADMAKALLDAEKHGMVMEVIIDRINQAATRRKGVRMCKIHKPKADRTPVGHPPPVSLIPSGLPKLIEEPMSPASAVHMAANALTHGSLLGGTSVRSRSRNRVLPRNQRMLTQQQSLLTALPTSVGRSWFP